MRVHLVDRSPRIAQWGSLLSCIGSQSRGGRLSDTPEVVGRDPVEALPFFTTSLLEGFRWIRTAGSWVWLWQSAAAALLLAGAPAVAEDSGNLVKVKCYGANTCKGQAECKTSMNSCKGQGFVTMGEKACLEHFGRS